MADKYRGRFLRVRKLDEYQHYKDRNPPWVKLHARILEDYDFGRLPDATKAHALLILPLAARLGNQIPADSDWIATRIQANAKVDIDALVRIHFLELVGDPLPADESLPAEVTPQAPTETDTDFEALWQACERKVSKEAARKAFERAGKIGVLPPIDSLIATLRAWQRTDDWTKDNRKFQPHLATWINARRWNDVMPRESGRRQMGSDASRESAFADLGKARTIDLDEQP